MADTHEFDIDDPALAGDPYSVWARFRSTCPVGFTKKRGGYWYFLDYQSVRDGFRSPELMSNAQIKIPFIEGDPVIPEQLEGKEHAAWRAILDPLFTMERIDRYRSAIQEECTNLMERAVSLGECDFVATFTTPFPSRIFCRIMGLPPESLDDYLQLQRALSSVAARPSTADRESALAAYEEARGRVHDIFADMKAERLTNGLRDDVVSAVLTAEVDGRPVTDTEYHNFCLLMLSAGLETVTATLGNFFIYLADHPEQRQRLIDDPELIPKAVEELLRYESIVSPGRVMMADADIRGQQLRAGDRVLLMTGPAGRDPEMFENPDEVDFERSPLRHLAFGMGPHRCLGSHLARLELRVALEQMTRIMPNFKVTPGKDIVRNVGQMKTCDVLPLTIG